MTLDMFGGGGSEDAAQAQPAPSGHSAGGGSLADRLEANFSCRPLSVFSEKRSLRRTIMRVQNYLKRSSSYCAANLSCG